MNLLILPAAPPSSSAAARGGGGKRRFNSYGTRTLLQWKNGSTGLRCPSFFGGDLRVLGIAGTEGFGRSLRGVRMMGGGPRTFPGGVSKWQWKRMREKKEMQMEKGRLMRERRVFQERRRQEVVAESPGSEKLWELSSPPRIPAASSSSAAIDPRTWSSANIFRKDGEEDLLSSEGEPEEGRILEYVEGGWRGSKEEVEEQIVKVRYLLRNRIQKSSRPATVVTTSPFNKFPLSPLSLKALHRVLGVQTMTRVQEATLPIILKGRDLLARTKGGNDEITASLLHAIQMVLETPRQTTVSGRHPVNVLLLCPTRERADFVLAEARSLLMFHTAVRVQIVMGGSDFKKEQIRLHKFPCEILIATPGRLLFQLKKSPAFRGQLRGVKVFVLDELQKLLDMGYRQAVEGIIRFLPKTRQTLLWSTSQSDEVCALAQYAMKKDYAMLNTFEGEDKVAHKMARQGYLVVPIENHLAFVYSILQDHFQQEPNGKVVVFCTTIRTSTLMSELYRKCGLYTRELHMRKRETHRTRVAAEFRTSEGGLILFTSGASVWGVANPDVTLVLQVGSPSGREQYVQRVTSTGQEEKERQSLLILMPHEDSFLKQLSGLPVVLSSQLKAHPESRAKVQHALQEVDAHLKIKAYLAWLRYSVINVMSTSAKQEVVLLASAYATALGFRNRPLLSERTIAELGLSGFLS